MCNTPLGAARLPQFPIKTKAHTQHPNQCTQRSKASEQFKHKVNPAAALAPHTALCSQSVTAMLQQQGFAASQPSKFNTTPKA
jgi:hypothetical protein